MIIKMIDSSLLIWGFPTEDLRSVSDDVGARLIEIIIRNVIPPDLIPKKKTMFRSEVRLGPIGKENTFADPLVDSLWSPKVMGVDMFRCYSLVTI